MKDVNKPLPFEFLERNSSFPAGMRSTARAIALKTALQNVILQYVDFPFPL